MSGGRVLFQERSVADLMSTQILVSDIQRFSLHDGPGIRSTVFLKGCTLHCPWCSNPETILPQPQPMVRNGKETICGKWMTQEQLLEELLKDRLFYNERSTGEFGQLPGGVTFSGGEPLAQIEAIAPVIDALHEEGIHVACETSLYVGAEKRDRAMELIDFFYVDLKILDAQRAMRFQRGDVGLYRKNLDALLHHTRDGKRLPVVIRIPVIAGYTDDQKQQNAVCALLRDFFEKGCPPLKAELLKEHSLGAGKYRSLGLPVPGYQGVEDALMESYCRSVRETGIRALVCRV